MDMDYEKLGIGLVAIAIFFLVATRLPPMLMGGAARMMGAGRRSRAADGEPEHRPAPRAAGRSDVPGFAREAVDAVEGDWDEISRINATVAQLADRKRRVVAREGDLLRSRVAWKVVAFEQAALQRVLALAGGTVRLWNLRSVPGAVLCSRAVIECAAVLLGTARELGRLAAAGDLAGIDALVTRVGFGGPAGGGSAAAPVDLPGLIDACDRQAPGTRARYDILAGLSDAGALGQVGLAGDLDKSGTTVTFSDTAMFESGLLGQVAGGLQALAVVDTALGDIDALLPRVVELDNA